MTERTPLKIYLGLVAFSLAGSLLSHLTHLDPGPIAPITSVATLFVGCWAAFGGIVKRNWAALALVLLIGASSEICGLATGWPFGSYRYSTKWWPTVPLGSLGPFPLLLPIAWLLVAGASGLVVASRVQAWWSPLLAGLLATLIDLVMEPVMTQRLGYWVWLEPGPLPGGAPWMNALGWFLVSSIAAVVLLRGGRVKDVSLTEPLAVLGGHLGLILGLELIGRL